jgi:hypothetical protein
MAVVGSLPNTAGSIGPYLYRGPRKTLVTLSTMFLEFKGYSYGITPYVYMNSVYCRYIFILQLSFQAIVNFIKFNFLMPQ